MIIKIDFGGHFFTKMPCLTYVVALRYGSTPTTKLELVVGGHDADAK